MTTANNLLMHTGLVSVTFRQLAPREIITLAAAAGLHGLEWGGDVHAPHGDLGRAAEVGRMTVDAGLKVAGYGSYYRLGASPQAGLAFSTVLETAVALGAPLIRIWAGDEGSATMAPAKRAAVLRDAEAVAAAAARHGVRVCCEFHGGTLTDTPESAAAFYQAVRHPALAAGWQPRPDWPPETNDAALRGLLPRLAEMHVFHWLPGAVRQPLAAGRADWRRYADIVRHGTAAPPWLLLEFTAGDSVQQFQADADALRQLLNAGAPASG
ncbi:MAG: TIM barrel protein [Lentisphaeria bacterium]